jgi:hypothetical protein
MGEMRAWILDAASSEEWMVKSVVALSDVELFLAVGGIRAYVNKVSDLTRYCV